MSERLSDETGTICNGVGVFTGASLEVLPVKEHDAPPKHIAISNDFRSSKIAEPMASQRVLEPGPREEAFPALPRDFQ